MVGVPLISEIKNVIMWSKSSSEIVKAKMLLNYLEDCQKKELHEMREKKRFPSQFSWIGKKFRKRFTSKNPILQK